MSIDSNKVIVKLEGGYSQQQTLGSISRIVAVLDNESTVDGFRVCSLTTGSGYDVFLDSLQSLSGIYLAEPYYISETGSTQMVGDGICVAFNESVTYVQIDSINSLHGVVIDRERIGRQKSFTLKNTDSSGCGVVELANVYHNLSEVEYAHPDFKANIIRFGYNLYDYYHLYQQHIKKVIGSFNSLSVWDYAGLTDSVIIAVIDDGVGSHEDLPGSRILSGYDFAGGPPLYLPDGNPSPGTFQAHGLSVA
ncbi:MAG: hypothetical protein ACREBV_00840, partial [Candidatus Zixiibacteriota bacterium]